MNLAASIIGLVVAVAMFGGLWWLFHRSATGSPVSASAEATKQAVASAEHTKAEIEKQAEQTLLAIKNESPEQVISDLEKLK